MKNHKKDHSRPKTPTGGGKRYKIIENYVVDL